MLHSIGGVYYTLDGKYYSYTYLICTGQNVKTVNSCIPMQLCSVSRFNCVCSKYVDYYTHSQRSITVNREQMRKMDDK